MNILEQTLTVYVRGVFIAGLILGTPLLYLLIKDLLTATKESN
jgi:hypothetical protein